MANLQFLDTVITHYPDESLSTTIHREATHTDKHLDFRSHHPLAHKIAMRRTLFSRARSLLRTLIKNWAMWWRVWSGMGIPRVLLRWAPPRGNRQKRTMSPPELQWCYPTFVGCWSLSEESWHPFTLPCFRPYRTLSNILVHPKDPMSPDQRKGVMYRIPCVDCDMTNVGQTGCTIQVRRKEHLRALTNADPQTSALAEHALTHHHEMKPRFWIPTHVWTKDVHKRHGIFVPSPNLWTENLVCYLKCITHWSSLQLHLTLLFDLTFPQFISLFHSSCVCLQSYCIFLIIAHLFPNYH